MTDLERPVFRLLGPLEIGTLELGGQRQRALIAHLLIHRNRALSADQLIDAVWGERPPRSVVSNLHTYVSRLRRLLPPRTTGEPRLSSGIAGYTLGTCAREVDVDVFEELVAVAHRVHRDRQPEAALRLLAQADALWRGELLAGLPAPEGEASRLAEARLAAIEFQLSLQVSVGDVHTVVTRARALLALHRAGQRAEALRVYAEARAKFADELGVDPGPELRDAHQIVLRGDRIPAVSQADEQFSPIQHLPADLADFTGRTEVVTELRDLLTANPPGGPAMVLITGVPGAGKSALAVHVAHQVRDSFPDGQLYVDLADAEPADILVDLLQALGITGGAVPRTVSGRAAIYRTRLAGRKMLVVLDDAANADQVRPLLPGGEGCAVLLTSRRTMGDLGGVRRFELPALSDEDAIELLCRLAGEPVAHAGQIVHACGHLPLAIRAAATRLTGRHQWSAQLLRDRLTDEANRISELQVGSFGVRASFEVSVRQLSPVARTVFRRLALLGGQDTPGWVAGRLANVEDWRAPVDELLDAGLLHNAGLDDTGWPRYRMHDLLRCHAAELLTVDSQEQQRAAVARTVAEWLELAARAAVHLPKVFGAIVTPPQFPGQLPARTWFMAERAALPRAVGLAAERGLHELAWRLAATCVPYFDMYGRYDDWLRSHNSALPAVRAAGNLAGEAALLRGLGQVHTYQDRYPDATRAFSRAAELFRELGDAGSEGCAIAGLGAVHRATGEAALALERYEVALELLMSAGDKHSTAQVLSSIGSIHRAAGRLTEAKQWLTHAYVVARKFADDHRQATVLTQLAELSLATGDHPRALRHAEDATKILGRLADERCAAHAMLSQAKALLALGSTEMAHPLARRALTVFSRTGNRYAEATSWQTLAQANVALADTGAARQALRTALGIWQELEADEQATAILAQLLNLEPITAG